MSNDETTIINGNQTVPDASGEKTNSVTANTDETATRSNSDAQADEKPDSLQKNKRMRELREKRDNLMKQLREKQGRVENIDKRLHDKYGLPAKNSKRLPELYDVIGDPIQGGMGSVVRVHHTAWNVDLAMKQPHAHLFKTDVQKQIFIHECESWIGLGLHPNIVSCYYVRDINGTLSVFSEWMDGGSLKDAITKEALYQGDDTQVLGRILDIAIQFARGLQYAHKNNLIHQDVKPDNLLLTKEGNVKVADFGIARARGMALGEKDSENGGTIIAQSGAYTPAYCSPEQRSGAQLTRRTDIWSWAVSLLEMFVGERLWPDGIIAGLACNDYMADARVNVPGDMADLISRCLKEDEADRPHDFAEVECDLLEIYEKRIGTPYARLQPKAAADTADSLNNKALSFLDIGKPEEAEKCWREALAINPNHTECVYNQMLYSIRTGDILKKQKTDSSKKHNISIMLRLAVRNDDWKSLYYLARICMEYKEYREAHKYFYRALKYSKTKQEKSDALNALALLRGRRNSDPVPKPEWALCKISTVQETLKQESDIQKIETQIRKAIETKDIAEALSLMQEAVLLPAFEFSPLHIRLHHMIGKYCKAVGFYSFALNDLFSSIPGGIHSLRFSHDNKFAIYITKTAAIDIFDIEKREVILTYAGNVKLFCVSPIENKLFCYCTEGDTARCRVFNFETGEETVFEWTGEGDIDKLQFSPDGRTIAIGRGGASILLWSLEKQRQLFKLEPPIRKKDEDFSMGFAPDGNTLVGVCPGEMIIWDVISGKILRRFPVDFTGQILRISPDGKIAIVGSAEQKLKSWDIMTGRCITTYQSRHNKFFVMSADGNFVLSLNISGLFQIQETGSGRFIHNITGFTGSVRDQDLMQSNADGNLLYVKGYRTDSGDVQPNGDIWNLLWKYEFPGWKDWDEGARPYLEIFLSLNPAYNEDDFNRLILGLQDKGYGWLRPEGVRAKLIEMKT